MRIEYHTVVSVTLPDFDKYCAEYMGDGWQPVGGPFTSASGVLMCSFWRYDPDDVKAETEKYKKGFQKFYMPQVTPDPELKLPQLDVSAGMKLADFRPIDWSGNPKQCFVVGKRFDPPSEEIMKMTLDIEKKILGENDLPEPDSVAQNK